MEGDTFAPITSILTHLFFLFFFCHQEVSQEAGPAGLDSGRHHRHRVSDCGEVRPQHYNVAHPILHHPVLDLRNDPHLDLDAVALLHSVRPLSAE